jgi:murein L,D-transpeptidase YcbB/YkuD
VKSVRFERLLASTALGVLLALSSHAAMAQPSDPKAELAVSVADVATAAKDANAEQAVEAAIDRAVGLGEQAADSAAPQAQAEKSGEPTQSTQDAAGSDSTAEPKQDAAAPAADVPAKTAATPEATPARSALSEQLEGLIAGKRLDRYVARKDDREGVEAFYKARDYKPLWVSDGSADARAKAARAYLEQVETVGLDSRDYPLPNFQADIAPADLAADELKFTNSVLKYARQAQIGRIHFSRVGADIAFKLEAPDPAKVLEKLAATDDMAKALDSYNPPQDGFQALKKKLAELRANGGKIEKPKDNTQFVRIPEGKTLKEGMKDPRVVLLRKRLNAAGDKDSSVYDNDVIEAVKAFQTGADLRDDGILGPNTLAALNGEKTESRAPADPMETVIVNMERWRWLPRKLGNDNNDYVIENTPDYTLTLYHHGEPYWTTKIVVGKPGKATPMISADMKYITVNPTWNVPPSIIENEYLPALMEDPTVLDRYGLKIYQDPDGTVHIYQPPGAGNALGRIRFNFPNKFLVYQHDTPDKYLFKRDKRAYSHGCMRVQNPLDYAVKLLSIELPKEHYTQARLESMYGDSEINISFPNPIPVHLTYQTAFVDQDGKLQFRDDVYGRDARMIQILKGSERKVADIPVEHPKDPSALPVRMAPGTYASYDGEYGGYGRYDAGAGFFGFLFGAGSPAPRYRSAPRYEPRYRYRPRGFIGPNANSNGHYSQR